MVPGCPTEATGKSATSVPTFCGINPPAQAPQSNQPEYVPAPEVINQNDAFEYALSSAPNVLYARYKQYGQASKRCYCVRSHPHAPEQLGVLGWCSEFSELIDGLKELGCSGNMFVTTRACALNTCSELLKLKLDIEMQIIVMYLSSQVSRLRRFLDGDSVWDDYPLPHFPLQPHGESSR